jgi:hypothetical protein
VEADSLEAKARDAILDLWQARSAWPEGWPPPRAAAVTRLLDELPAPDDEVGWYHQTALQKLQYVHHQILAGLVDLAEGSDTDVEQKWLDRYGEHLTPDEARVLRRITQQPRRTEALLRWSAQVQANRSSDKGNDASATAAVEPLRQLVDMYQATVTNLLERITREPEAPSTGDAT